MSEVVKIKPNFNRLDRSLSFATRDVNYLLTEQVYDHFNFYQKTFGVYSFMRLTEDLKHRVFSMSAAPFAWQPHTSCSIDPLGVIRTNVRETTPVRATAMSKFCYDELFDSCFRVLLGWNGQGPVQMNAAGRRMFDQLLLKVLESMVLGARLSLTAGKLYEGNLNFKDDVQTSIQNLMNSTVGTVQGWIDLVKTMAATEPGSEHLNVPGLFTADDFDGDNYVGSEANIVDSVLALVDKMRNSASVDLNSIMDQGGINDANGVSGNPIILASTYIYKAIAEAFRVQGTSALLQNPRLQQEMRTWRGRQYKVYFIDGMPVIPIHDLNQYDRYLTTTTHLAAITLAGNINLGCSFTNIPAIDAPGMAVRIKMSDDNEDYGNYTFRSDSLFSTILANSDYYVGGVKTLTAA